MLRGSSCPPIRQVDHDDFLTRAVHRMHEVGIITTAARDRLLEAPMPTDPHMRLGIAQALLSVALWRGEENA